MTRQRRAPDPARRFALSIGPPGRIKRPLAVAIANPASGNAYQKASGKLTAP
jgi:hypothetical protein